jgi:Tfp pilus assembly PilM family ATPase
VTNLARGSKDKEHAMSQNLNSAVAVIGIDIGKNSFHVVGLDNRGAMCCVRSGRVARSKHG